MTLVKHNFRTFNDFANDFFANTYVPARTGNLNVPPVNIYETDESFNLEVIAPGLKKEDFKVNIEKGLLTISYEKKNETEKTYRTLKREFGFEGFKRSFSIDNKINADAIQAKYESGVLTLILPKKEEVKVTPKEISVQ